MEVGGNTMKLKINNNQIIETIPNGRDELVKENARLRFQNEFLRKLLDSRGIKIPESMDDFLEARELGINKDVYIVDKLDMLNASLSMQTQLLLDIKMNMK